MKLLNTPEKRTKFLKKLKIGFLIPSLCVVLAVIFSYVLDLLMIGGILFLIGFAFLELFMAFFWILNLIMMWKWKRRVYFFCAIIIPFLSLFFYFYNLYPFLKGENQE
jgi:hypothetical protein